MGTLENIQAEILSKTVDIVEKYKDQSLRINDDVAGPMKYIRDIPCYVKESYERFIFLGLDKTKDLKILDLCSGAGYFLYICNKRHKAVGIEWLQYFGSETGMLYSDLAKVLDNTIYDYHIETGRCFRIRRKFDLITAFYPCFNHLKGTRSFWEIEDWVWFIEYVMNKHLLPNGRLVLKPLKRPAGASSEELFDLLVKQYKAKYKARTFILRNHGVDTQRN